MIVELESSCFGISRRLWVGMSEHLTLESILSGEASARMFVDDAEEPKAALTWSGCKVYLSGDVNITGFRDVLRQYACKHERFVVYPSSEALGYAEMLLSNHSVDRRLRLYYEGDPSGRSWVVMPPEGYVVERITRELMGVGLIHTDLVKDEMCSERGSMEEFLAKSFGFAAVQDGKFVSWCMSEYNLGHRCEVGIARAGLITLGRWRQLSGLA
jgi:hypothetical protein